MLRIFLILGYFSAGALCVLTLILRMRMTREVNTLLEGNKISVFSSGDLDASKLHHRLFPRSHLAPATKASLGVAFLLLLATSAVRLLTL